MIQQAFTVYQTEICDIILGMDISGPSAQRQAAAEIEENKPAQAVAGALGTVTVRTTNIHGDEIVTTTRSPHEQQAFQSKTDWRQRALTTTSLIQRAQNVSSNSVEEASKRLLVPGNLVRRLVTIGDLRSMVGAWLYGVQVSGTRGIVKVAVMVPQWSSHQGLQFIPDRPEHPSLKSMTLLGLCILSSSASSESSEELQRVLAQFPVTVRVMISGGSSLVSGTTVEGHGVNVVLQGDQLGFFLVPEDGVWNLGLTKPTSSSTSAGKIMWKVDDPVGFYDERQRASHFLSFVQLVSSNTGASPVDDEMERLELVD